MMFDSLVEISKSLRTELLGAYWILLPPLLVFLVLIDLLQKKNPDPINLLRRTIISVLLIFSFDLVTDAITIIGDGLMQRLEPYNNSWEILKTLGPTDHQEASSGFFDFRGHVIYLIAVLAYLVAYLGFFMAEAMTHFVWLILHICSPLMILCYVPQATASVTKSLYTGLVKVVVWKVLWMILGALLLKMASNATLVGSEAYFTSIILNLCIGLSMLFVPWATKSLIKDGFEGAAGALSVLPATIATAKFRLAAHAIQKKGQQQIGRGMSRVNASRSQIMSRNQKNKISNPNTSQTKRNYHNATRQNIKNNQAKSKAERQKPTQGS